jgi:protein-arginine kinase activator protein McsA
MGKEKKAEKEKPIEKMTVKELREIGKTIEGIVGVHGMNKPELITEIKKARGIKEAPKAKGTTTKEIKAKIKAVKTQRRQALEAKDSTKAARYRKQISRLKKKTRKAA